MSEDQICSSENESYEEENGQDFEDSYEQDENGLFEQNEDDTSGQDLIKHKLEQKESRREQKLRKIERQSSKKNFDLLQTLKKLWEIARQQNLPPKERQSIIEEMSKITQGNIVDLIFKHDSSRIIQTIVKYGSIKQRNSIAIELKGKFSLLACGKYSKHLVERLLKVCPEHRNEIILEFKGKVKKLVKHKEASQVLETIYIQFANAKQKRVLVQEFYGSEFKLFGDGSKTLGEIFTSFPEKKSSILKNMLDTISSVLDKGTVSNCLVHHVILEYLEFANQSQCDDLCSLLREQIAEIVHTHLGYKIAIICIANSPVKERKNILKSFKPFLDKIIQEEYGHLVLIACMALIDDTVLIEKTICAELIKGLDQYYLNPYGKKVIMFPFVCLNSKYYGSPFAKFLESMIKTSSSLEFSKKPLDQKLEELKKSVLSSTQSLVSRNAKNFICDFNLATIALECGDWKDFLVPLEEPFSNEDNVLKNTNSGFFYKKVIQKFPSSALSIYQAIQSEICDLALNPMTCFLVLTLFNDPNTKELVSKDVLAIKSKMQELGQKEPKILTVFNQLFSK